MHYGVLGYAIDVPLDMVPYQEYTWIDTMYWYNTKETNIKAIATIFNGEGHAAYSVPPSGSPFTAHYADAVVGALPGETNDNSAPTGGFTHTMLLEDLSTDW